MGYADGSEDGVKESNLDNAEKSLIPQYRDASNLNARVRLHERFSTNHHGWHEWVFDHLRDAPGSRILELGCGPGYLWLKNLRRAPDHWQVTLSDRSPGMLAEAQRNLAGSKRRFHFAIADAQSIPWADGSFDVVIANHLLYHLTDRTSAVAEIRRVLRPDGRFYASTTGRTHLRELYELIDRSVGQPIRGQDSTAGFSLENGGSLIARWFPRVRVHRYEDALVVTEADALLAYVASMRVRLSDGHVQALRRLVDEQLAARGAVRLTKDSGLFEAWASGGG